jgi:tetratricopeptide (TPR) repeat protein
MSRRRSYLAIPVLLMLALTGAHAQEAREAAPDPIRVKAVKLLDDVAENLATLHAPGNRIHISCLVAELLWEVDEPRARAVIEDLMKMLGAELAKIDPADSESYNNVSTLYQQRQQIFERVARQDPELALKFLQETRQMFPQSSFRGGNLSMDNETNLELHLATMIGERDPEKALKIARATLERGVSYNHIAVLTQLHKKDDTAAQKFYGELVERISTSEKTEDNFGRGWNLLASFQPPSANDDTYRRLVDLLLSRMLAINPTDATHVRLAQNMYHQVRNNMQTIEQHSPSRAGVVNQWLRKVIQTLDPNTRLHQEINEMGQARSAEAMLALRSKYPEELHPNIVQQVVWNEINTGNFDRARKLANELIPESTQRAQLLAQIDSQKLWRAANDNQVDEARALARKLNRPDQSLHVLTQLAMNLASKGERKQALELLDEAREVLATAPRNSARASAQLQLARTYATLDPQRSLELLQPFVAQINELVAAAMTLDGFENRCQQEGEWVVHGYTTVNSIINDFDVTLSVLANERFDSAYALASQLERPEIRLLARVSVLRQALNKEEVQGRRTLVPITRHFGYGRN